MRVLSGGGADTIDVWDTLVVEARVHGVSAFGKEVVFHAVRLHGDSVFPVLYLGKPGCCFGLTIRDTTDNGGRASVVIIHGPYDGTGFVVVGLEGSDRADTVQVITNPGMAVGTQVFPQDRPIVIGGSYLIGARQVDRRGNTVLSSVTFTATSNVVDISPAGIVHGNVIGRARITIQLGSRTDSAFTSVVPQATLALRDPALSVTVPVMPR